METLSPYAGRGDVPPERAAAWPPPHDEAPPPNGAHQRARVARHVKRASSLIVLCAARAGASFPHWPSTRGVLRRVSSDSVGQILAMSAQSDAASMSEWTKRAACLTGA